MAREYGALALQQAVTAAVAFGGSDVGAVQLLLSPLELPPQHAGANGDRRLVPLRPATADAE